MDFQSRGAGDLGGLGHGGSLGLERFEESAPYSASGRVVAEFRSVAKDYGEKRVFSGVNFVINRGDRIALVRIDDDFYAIGDECSHADFSLAEGEIDAFAPDAATLAQLGKGMFFDPALSASGRLLAASTYSGDIHVVALDGAAPPFVVSGLTQQPVLALAFSPDGTLLASGGGRASSAFSTSAAAGMSEATNEPIVRSAIDRIHGTVTRWKKSRRLPKKNWKKMKLLCLWILRQPLQQKSQQWTWLMGNFLML